jgi:diguanylate cyclase (GGDEF)-like protein
MNVPQVGLMALEIVSVSLLFLACIRLRNIFGLVPLYSLIGVLFYTCGFLAATVYVHAAPDLVVSPGSVAFFPAIVFTVLCVYVTEDAIEARKLIYGLLVTEIFVVAIGWATALHLGLAGVINEFHLVPEMFTTSLRVTVVSMLALFADTVIIILAYELISRYTSILFLRILLSTTIVLAIDTLIFITGAYIENPQYVDILTSALIGKSLAAVLYSVLFTVYLRYLDAVEPVASGHARGLGSMFRTLTYRQKFELLQERSARDPLTGLYNRGFFDEILLTQSATAHRTQRPLALLMVDIDHFKQVNDTLGHVVGDRVLAVTAAALAGTFRSSDYACRFGGEEFAVLLPNTDLAAATLLAEKTRVRIAELDTGVRVTVTIGVAVYPAEAGSTQALIELVDQRLYEGKNSGRNRVVPSAVTDMIPTAN